MHRCCIANSVVDDGRQRPAMPCSSLATSEHRPEGLSNNLYKNCLVSFTSAMDPGAWAALALLRGGVGRDLGRRPAVPLYTPEQRRRRDTSPWTLLQGVLAPIQFAVFLVSLCLVIRYLTTGEGAEIATASIVIKTSTLYAIMITGSIWERKVFGCYLFAAAFFWEDVFSILVLALHTAYLAALTTGAMSVRDQMLLALAAYAAYAINATQFLLKLRAARRDQSDTAEKTAAICGRVP